MDSTNFEELSDNFTSKLDGVGMLLKLLDASRDKRCTKQLELLQMELNSQENKLIEVKKELAARKSSLEKISKLNEDLEEWKKKLTYMVDNMPALPKRHTSSDDVQPSQCSDKQETANTYCPEIDWLTTDEFDKIPKYLKGRLSYDQVNKFIEGMNKAYIAKYKLLKLKKASLNYAKKKTYETYKAQETKDTKGCYFVVGENLKEFGGLKMDNVAHSILTILRHCGRCREVRGGQLVRYCYIDSY